MSTMNRRDLLSAIAGTLSVVVGGLADLAAQRRPARRARRRVRRRVRRRIRRHITVRTIAGRRVWVAPVALAVGWELVLGRNRVVTVREVKFVERGGARVEIAVVEGSDGKREELEIVREDTAENGKDLQGSILPDDDKTTPAIEKEEEVDQ